MSAVEFHSKARRWIGTLCLLATVPVPVLAAAPSPIGMTREVMDGSFMLQFLAGLAIVLVSIAVLAWLMKRAGGLRASAHGTLRVIDGIALSARERIVLVQVGETQVLLGVAPGRVSRVHVLDQQVATVPQENAPVSFAERLRQMLGGERVS
ncbi:MAG: flagellar biosynthetic protein FliO [Pseudomonadota bacterium]